MHFKNKNHFLLSLTLVSCLSLTADAVTKLDPALNQLSQTRTSKAAQIMPHLTVGLKVVADKKGEALVDVFLKTTDTTEMRQIIEQWGGEVRTVAGSILTAYVPVAFLDDLAALDITTYIESSKPVRRKLNQSVPLTGADDVRTNSASAVTAGLSSAYTGSGVIVGVVDTGIDCDHADYTDDGGDTRILAYWDQTTGTSGVSEITGSEGTEYTGAELSDGTCTSATDPSSGGGHGSHVAGIAAGR